MPDNGGNLKKDLSAEEFCRFRDWIHRHSGIYLEEGKLDSLRISLVTRATRFGILDYDEYYELLSSSEDEFRELMNLVTINETSFFRFPAQFEALRDFVIPEILESKGRSSRSFRVWSAGCSTGEEPYTIAMTLLDSMLEGCGYRCEVLGTDVSTQALDKAKAGVYRPRSIKNLSESVVERWFEPEADGYRPIERVRNAVDLTFHNLVKEPYPLALLSSWDVIFCRNVTIYFRIESTKRVVNNFYESLNPGGYLFIGHSETLSSISDRFEAVEIGGVFLYRKPAAKRLFTFGDGGKVERKSGLLRAVRHPVSTVGQAARPTSRLRARSETIPSTRSTPVALPVESESAEENPPASGIPKSTVDLIKSARELLELGRPDDARALADEVLVTEPQNVEALLVRSYAHADAGDLEAAVTDASTAVSVDPLLASARYILGIIYLREGEEHAALAEFKRTMYIDHEFVLAYFNAANIYRSRGAIDDACREYENALRAIESSPDGSWTAFLGGFRPDLLAKTCERSLIECRKGAGGG
jgi:chemotaxis protein methyltransferase CheR